MNDIIENEFNEHIKISNSIHYLTDSVAIAAEFCIESLKSGGKIILFGNGGSAADAQHIAAELVGRYKIERRSLPAIALTTDTSALTAIGNDYGYIHIFDRQLEALANKGDVVIGISTSGESINVNNALKLASELNCKTIGFSGQNVAAMKDICDVIIDVPSKDTPRIQEMHILIGHIICHLIDQEFKDY
jgi:D-sedoheptulose 7-phosphate isomerase